MKRIEQAKTEAFELMEKYEDGEVSVIYRKQGKSLITVSFWVSDLPEVVTKDKGEECQKLNA